MAIFAQRMGTWPGPIRNMVEYEFKKNTRSGSESGPGFIKNLAQLH